MYMNLLSELTSNNAALEEQLRLSPNSAEHIDIYREKKLELLNQIDSLTASGAADSALLPLWKLGAEIASDIVRTRVIQAAGDGFQRTAPYPVSPELRETCTEIYHILTEKISSVDRMYMAPAFEKHAPGKDKRLAAMRLHDLQHQQSQAERQSANRSINRLFGSRG